MLLVPPHPFLEAEKPRSAFVQVADASTTSTLNGGRTMSEWLGGDFKVGRHETVVVIGCTPPPARYFSITPYLHTLGLPGHERAAALSKLPYLSRRFDIR